MMDEKEELKRQKVLVDIYKNENEHLKYEYRVLHDNYINLNQEYEKINTELESFKNSRICKLFLKIKKSFLYRALKKKNRIIM